MKFFGAVVATLALAAALAGGLIWVGSADAVTTTLLANDATLTWTVTGSVQGVPGAPPVVPFSCTGLTTTKTICQLTIGNLNLSFVPASTTNYSMTVGTIPTCTGVGTCTPLDASTGAAVVSTVAATCGSGTTNTFSASQTVRLFYPASCGCNGGQTVMVTILWSAVSSTCSA